MAVSERHLQVASSSSLNQFSPEKVELIKNTVAKGTSNEELEMFLYLASQYGLDPFKREIWCIKYDPKSAATIMTSRDGYLKIAQSNPEYDGLKSFVVHEGDEFQIDAMTDQITHKFGAKRGKIIGAWAAAYHKSMRPQICFVEFDEYNAGNSTWKKYPSAMIQKVAESFVLKRQFGINGLVTQEEMSRAIEIPNGVQPQVESEIDQKTLWNQTAKELSKVAKDAGGGLKELRQLAQAMFKVSDIHDLTIEQMVAMRDNLLASMQSAEPESAPEQVPVKATTVEEADTDAGQPIPFDIDGISDDDLPF